MAKEKNACNGYKSSRLLRKENIDSAKLDESTQSTLENLFEIEQETYEQFLNSFMYLNKEKISSTKNTVQSVADSPDQKSRIGESEVIIDSDNIVSEPHSDIFQEEEVVDLTENSVTVGSIMTRLSNQPLHVQLDNFVEEHLGYDKSCYDPSFLGGEGEEGEVNIPGQVLDENVTPVSVPSNKTQLTTCCRLSTSSQNLSNQLPEEEKDLDSPVCKVETFELDEDFDYDNVETTPKFDFLSQRR